MQIKETVLDVLLYLFENYFDDELEAVADQSTLEQELLGAGFPSEQIMHAFDWLADLDDRRDCPSLPASGSFRLYSEPELARMTSECRSYLLQLERVGILDADSRETVIDRLLALNEDELDEEHVKWVVLMVLFIQPGQEDNFARMEDLLFDPSGELMH